MRTRFMPLIIFIALSFSVAAALASRAGAEEVRKVTEDGG